MFGILKERLRQKYRTARFPAVEPVLPDRFRGCPSVDHTKCGGDCHACVSACPTGALARENGGQVRIDLGRCLFCTDCTDACPAGAITFSRDYRLATRTRDGLDISPERRLQLAAALDAKSRSLFGHSLGFAK